MTADYAVGEGTMNNQAPLVSVIIPTRHRVKLLQRAVDSVNASTYSAIEIIIVDNAADIPLVQADIRSDLPLRIVRTPHKFLLPQSRNFGAESADGALLSFLDDDDEIEWMKVGLQAEALAKDGSLDFVYGDTRCIGPNGETLVVSSGPPELVHFLRWRYIHTNALTVRREVFEALKYEESMSTFEDVEFTGRLMRRYRGLHIPEIHARWYRDNRPDQLTRRNLRRTRENWLRLCERFNDVIVSDVDLRRFYHRKMLILSLMFGDMRQASKSLPLAV